MKFKTNLHLHTNDDPMDAVEYSIFDAIDHARERGFNVLAMTCHQKYALTDEYVKYANERGVALIGGIEINVHERAGAWGRHVLIIGANKDAEEVRTFDDLASYKANNENALIMAPHPYFYGNFSLHEYLERYIHLFDAIEHSWFYSKIFNRNNQAISIADKYNLPMVATSDTHYLDFMDENYAVVEAEEKSEHAIITAVKRGMVENTTSPRKLWSEMIFPQAKFSIKTLKKRWLH